MTQAAAPTAGPPARPPAKPSGSPAADPRANPGASQAPGPPSPDTPLPLLRPDLEFLPGPPEHDGSPTTVVHDPLARTYAKLGWAEAEILARLRRARTLGALVQDLERTSTLRPSAEDVLLLCRHAQFLGLTADGLIHPVSELIKRDKARRIKVLTWLLHHYLYFRVPLIRPDAFLAATLPLVRFLGSRAALALYALFFGLGLVLLLENPAAYVHTFGYFFDLAGLAHYGLAIMLIKAVHEFAHAYTAKHFGVRVPVMGLAFIVMWPVAYCDVTDAWRVPERGKRLAIALAGIAAELVIAGVALLGWGLTLPGAMNSVFFTVSSVSLASTLLVNLNPAMRYDGYYIFMDVLGVDNLQPRAFALTLYLWRTRLLGLSLPHPEPGVTPRLATGMVLYSLYAWAYRLALYLGIAVLVYHKFTKVLGAFLFAVEIGWFIVAPAAREAKELLAMKERFRLNRPLVATLSVLAVLILWAALPLPRTLEVPAAAVPAKAQTVYAPHPGILSAMAVRRGMRVEKGQMLAQVVSDELATQTLALRLERDILVKELAVYAGDEKHKALLPQKREELAAVDAQLAALDTQAAQNTLTAEVAGLVYEWDENLYLGRPVSKDAVLGRIADLSSLRVAAFVPEEAVGDLSPGQSVRFSVAGMDAPMPGTVERVSPSRAVLVEYPALTSEGGGTLAVRKDAQGRLHLLDSVYQVDVALTPGHAPLAVGQSGHIRLHSAPRSIFAEAARAAYRVFMRESNF